MDPDHTADLVRIRNGDDEAFAELVRCWDQRLYRLAYRIPGNGPDAEEARQAVFTRIIEKPECLPDAICFAAWIRRCVVNEAISIARNSKRRDQTLNQLAREPPSAAAAQRDVQLGRTNIAACQADDFAGRNSRDSFAAV